MTSAPPRTLASKLPQAVHRISLASIDMRGGRCQEARRLRSPRSRFLVVSFGDKSATRPPVGAATWRARIRVRMSHKGSDGVASAPTHRSIAMEHYVAYHSTKIMGRDYAPGQEFGYRSKKSESFLRGAIGAWAWVIVGEKTAGGTAFRLVGVYAVAEVREEDEGFVVSGPGHPFDPPLPLNTEPWFPELLQEQANFSLGFNRIRGDVVVAALEDWLAAAGSASLGVPPSAVATFSSRDDPNAHATFQAWREANPDGFFLNCQTATRGLLHRVDCSHLGDTSWDGSDLARLRKACAAGLSVLRRWGEGEGVRDIRTCQDCDPVDDVQTAAQYADSMLADGSFPPMTLVMLVVVFSRALFSARGNLSSGGHSSRPTATAAPSPDVPRSQFLRRPISSRTVGPGPIIHKMAFSSERTFTLFLIWDLSAFRPRP